MSDQERPPRRDQEATEAEDEPVETDEEPQPKAKKQKTSHKDDPIAVYRFQNYNKNGKYSKKGMTSKPPADDKPPAPSDASKWYNDMNLAQELSNDQSYPFTIDVQPDSRYQNLFFIREVQTTYPRVPQRQYAQMSQPSIIAYYNALVTATLLLLDSHIRMISSYHANNIFNNEAGKRLREMLTGLYVPPELEDMLLNLAPCKDPTRPELQFIPTYAGYKTAHDFGRTIPMAIFLKIHDLLADRRDSTMNFNLLHEFYSTHLYTALENEYTISNIIGGPFEANEAYRTHQNWFKREVESLIQQNVGQRHQASPELQRIELAPILGPDDEEANPYSILLSWNSQNEETITSFLSEASRFFKTERNSKYTLKQIIASLSGPSVLQHMNTITALPTWHYFPRPVAAPAANPIPMNDADFATLTHMFTAGPVFNHQIVVPPQPARAEPQYEPGLLFAQVAQHDPLNSPVQYDTYEPEERNHPSVLYSLPYIIQTPAIANVIRTGFIIVNDELDGVVLPTVSPYDAPIATNSCYVQGSLPTPIIQPIIPNQQEANRVRIVTKRRQATQINKIGIAVRDMSRNVLPYFANANVQPNIVRPLGLNREDHHADPHVDYTYFGTQYPNVPTIAPRTLHVWSSYRNVIQPSQPNPQVWFYTTLQQFYGTSCVYVKSVAPEILLGCK